jgi:hypothetical protein
VYRDIRKALPKSHKKKLDEAKETIRSVDDLSSVLNTIFKEHGSELDKGFMVFSFGGKDHHYIPVDDELNKRIKALEKKVEKEGIDITDVFKDLLKDYEPKTTKRFKVVKHGDQAA